MDDHSGEATGVASHVPSYRHLMISAGEAACVTGASHRSYG